MGPKMIQSKKDGGGLSLTLKHQKDETLPDTCVVSVNLWLCRAMYGCVWLCMAVYGYVWLCRAMYGYVGLCRAV